MAYAEAILAEFVRSLEASGLPAGPDVLLRIQQLFHLQQIQSWEDLARAQHLVGPLLVRSKEEQERFRSLLAGLLRRQGLEPEPPVHTVSGTIRQVKKKSSRDGLVIAAGAIGLAVFLVWLFFPVQQPPEAKADPDHRDMILNTAGEAEWPAAGFAADTSGIRPVRFEWNFGDGSPVVTLPASQTGITHTFDSSRSATYAVSLKAYVAGRKKPYTDSTLLVRYKGCRVEANFFVSNPQPPNLDVPLIFTNASTGSCIRGYSWDFGDGSPVVAQDFSTDVNMLHSFRDTGNFRVTLMAATADTVFTYSKLVRISDKNDHIALSSFAPMLRKDTSAPPPRSRLYYLLLVLLLVALMTPVLFLFSRYYFRRRKIDRVLGGHYGRPAAPRQPYRLALPVQGEDVASDKRVAELAHRLRQQEKAGSQEMDIGETIKATVARAGFPQIAFNETSVRPGYLVLIESGNRNQLRLFGLLLDLLGKYRVDCRVYYFTGSMRTCFNDDYPDGIPIEKLALQYGSSRLLVYSDGYSLLNENTEDGLASWAGRVLAHWKNRALMTPVPRYNWDSSEKKLLEMFRLYPSDLQGHLLMAHDFNRGRYQLPPRRGVPATLYPFEGTMRQYKKYFGSERDRLLYRWLLALSVPGRVSWENILLVGRAVETVYGSPHEPLVTFDNLLRITGISWVNDGQLAPRHRLELHDALKQEPRYDALISEINRELYLQLNKLDLPKDSSAELERKVQLALLRFQLNEEERKATADELHYLDRQGLVPSFYRKTVYTDKGGYSRFAPGRRFIAWNSSVAVLLLVLFFGWGDSVSRLATDLTGLKELPATDSLAWYNNRAAELMAVSDAGGQTDEVVSDCFVRAAAFEPEDLPEDTLGYNRMLFDYRKGLALYARNQLEEARSILLDSVFYVEDDREAAMVDSFSGATRRAPPLTVYMSRVKVHAEGVCAYYLSEMYRDRNDSLSRAYSARAAYLDAWLGAQGFYKLYPDSLNSLNSLLHVPLKFRLTAKMKQGESGPVTISDKYNNQLASGLREASASLRPGQYHLQAKFSGSDAVVDTIVYLDRDLSITLDKGGSGINKAAAKFCLIRGQYIRSTGSPDLRLFLKNLRTGADAGTYFPNVSNGKYIIQLANGGEYLVSVADKDQTYHFDMEIPFHPSFEPQEYKQELFFKEQTLFARIQLPVEAGSGNLAWKNLPVRKQEQPAPPSTLLELELPDGRPAAGVEVTDARTQKQIGRTDAAGKLEIVYNTTGGIGYNVLLQLKRDDFTQQEQLNDLLPNSSVASTGVQSVHDYKKVTFRDYADITLVFFPCDSDGVRVHSKWSAYSESLKKSLEEKYPKQKFVLSKEVYFPDKADVSKNREFARAHGRIGIVIYGKTGDGEVACKIYIDEKEIWPRQQGGSVPSLLISTTPSSIGEDVLQALEESRRNNSQQIPHKKW